jgi:hypothetical protein
MIKFKAIATCDRCDVSTDITIEVRKDERGIPVLSIVEYVEGWHIDFDEVNFHWGKDYACSCPEHNPYNKNKKV